jgi:hypothetical protein
MVRVAQGRRRLGACVATASRDERSIDRAHVLADLQRVHRAPPRTGWTKPPLNQVRCRVLDLPNRTPLSQGMARSAVRSRGEGQSRYRAGYGL